jgi:hypothetical protein
VGAITETRAGVRAGAGNGLSNTITLTPEVLLAVEEVEVELVDESSGP